jgi:hypothetical protein
MRRDLATASARLERALEGAPPQSPPFLPPPPSPRLSAPPSSSLSSLSSAPSVIASPFSQSAWQRAGRRPQSVRRRREPSMASRPNPPASRLCPSVQSTTEKRWRPPPRTGSGLHLYVPSFSCLLDILLRSKVLMFFSLYAVRFGRFVFCREVGGTAAQI